MRCKILRTRVSPKFGLLEEGTIREFPDKVAQDFINQGVAVRVNKSTEKKTPKIATVEAKAKKTPMVDAGEDEDNA